MIIIREIKHYLLSSKVKLILLLMFFILFFMQTILGFNYFEDYLILLIFVLFLNDQLWKLNHSHGNFEIEKNDKLKRLAVSLLLFIIILIPSILEYLRIKAEAQNLFYKLGFILWAQVFLVDAFLHYKETKSKKWLLFANVAVVMVVVVSISI